MLGQKIVDYSYSFGGAKTRINECYIYSTKWNSQRNCDTLQPVIVTELGPFRINDLIANGMWFF